MPKPVLEKKVVVELTRSWAGLVGSYLSQEY